MNLCSFPKDGVHGHAGTARDSVLAPAGLKAIRHQNTPKGVQGLGFACSRLSLREDVGAQIGALWGFLFRTWDLGLLGQGLWWSFLKICCSL